MEPLSLMNDYHEIITLTLPFYIHPSRGISSFARSYVLFFMGICGGVLISVCAIAEAVGLLVRKEDSPRPTRTSSELTPPRQTRLEPIRCVRWLVPLRCHLPGPLAPKVVADDPPGGDPGDIQAALQVAAGGSPVVGQELPSGPRRFRLPLGAFSTATILPIQSAIFL